MDKISVIVAMYNVEKYLVQCLDSIVNQTYENLEIILVDDGSPDKCGVISDKYAARDRRIIVVHKENGGLSSAWNEGLKIATGKWIAFVDSDDWLNLNYFESMIQELGTSEPDILQAGGYIEEIDGKQSIRCYQEESFRYEEGTERDLLMIRTIVSEKGYATLAAVWSKLYKTSFIRSENLKFDLAIPAGLYNDAVFNFQAFGKAKLVIGCKYYGYHYRRVAGSSTLRFLPDRPKNMSYTIGELKKHCMDFGSSVPVKQAIDAFSIASILYCMRQCFFHPENTKRNKDIARDLKEMKSWDSFHEAIWNNHNPYLTGKQIAVKWLLRFPWVLPVKVLYVMNETSRAEVHNIKRMRGGVILSPNLGFIASFDMCSLRTADVI